MCRSIKVLFNVEPPADETELREAATQFVRKVSGTPKPSVVNRPAVEAAVDEIHAALEKLLRSLQTKAPRRDRPQPRTGPKREATPGAQSGEPQRRR